MKKLISMLILVAMFACLLTGCGSTASTETEAPAAEAPAAEPAAEDNSLVIGVTLHDLSSDGYAANLIGIKEYAASMGNVEIKAVSADGSAETQVGQVEDFITSGVDGIIILPVDSSALSNVVGEAVAAGIPVVSMDRSVDGDVATVTIESDNYKHGVEAADLMVKAAEEQGMTAADLKVLELLGAQASSSGLERHEGFADRCAELGVTIVSSLPTEWEADKAYNSVLDAFQANADINAIFEASDIAMHSGVSSALDQLGKYIPAGTDGHVIITSVDGGPNGIEAVKEGYIDAMAEQGLLIMGSEALEYVIAAINGDTIDNKLIQLAPVAVTKDNADSDELWPNKIA